MITQYARLQPCVCWLIQLFCGWAEYGAGRKELLRLLPTADIVVLACTQSAETKGLVDKAFLHACKRGVFIVNVARGGLLDYDAVSDGLAKGCIGGLGLDVAWEVNRSATCCPINFLHPSTVPSTCVNSL